VITTAPPRSRVGLGAHPALVAGAAAAVLLALACALAWRNGAAVAAQPGGAVAGGGGALFLALLALSFGTYLAGVLLARAREPALRSAAAVAVAVQLVPLGAPLLLSTDAWTYWAYGRIAAVGGDPYVEAPSSYPDSPAFRAMGAAWRETTSVYGPAFTLATVPVAAAVGSERGAVAWAFKTAAALALAAAALLAGRVARRRALAVGFVGWNPVLALHAGGGGHNDAWVAALLAAALALAAARRPAAAGAAWALAILLKWIPLLFLALDALASRAGGGAGWGRRAWAGLALTATAMAGLATWRFGLDWVRAAGPLAGNAALETSYAAPARLQQLGVPEPAALAAAAATLLAGLALLARRARRTGRPGLGRAACLVLLTTPYLIVWYLAWAVTLAGADEDRLARSVALALCAYLLPQTIPL
jgi:hypothetical protein